MSRVLIISEDIVGERMAGPAIRCVEIARSLGHSHRVILAVPGETSLRASNVEVCPYTSSSLKQLVAASDVVYISGYLASKYPFLKQVSKPIVVDIYDPFVLENLEIHSGEPLAQRVSTHNFDLGVLSDILRIGDFFICASEKQRDFWLGMLTALNRINPMTCDGNRSLRNLIDVVPFGIPAEKPKHTKSVLKGVYKTIKSDDKVLLWGGGIWNWFDPLTLIEAMNTIVGERTDIKLFFMGVKHPNPDIPEMEMCRRAIQRSKELNLYDKFVFFNEWVPYEQRQNYLLEADIGVSTHLEHLETQFSFRTRILDYIWAGLPIICTEGDYISELVDSHALGETVEAGDKKGLTEAILKLVDSEELRKKLEANVAKTSSRFRWDEASKPLIRFCREPNLAADKRTKFQAGENEAMFSSGELFGSKLFYYLRRAGYHLRLGGVKGLLARIKSFFRKKRS